MNFRAFVCSLCCAVGLIVQAGTYLPHEDEGGGQAVFDRSGQEPGRFSGAVRRVSPGRFEMAGRQALKFTGRDGFGLQSLVVTPTASDKKTDVAIQAWFKPEKMPADFTRLFCQGDDMTGNKGSFKLYTKKNRVIWALNVGGRTYELGTPAKEKIFTPGSWVHIAATYHQKNGLAEICINGQKVSRAVFPKGGIQDSAVPVTIGNRLQNDRGFIGLIDEMQVLRKDLTSFLSGFEGTLAKSHQKKEQKFEWEGTHFGVTDTVPAPWKPVQVRQDNRGGLVVTAADKEFIFGKGILPEQIRYMGRDILAGGFQALVDRRPLQAVPGTLQVVKLCRRSITLMGRLADGNREFAGKMTVEFDGLSTLEIMPSDSLAGARVADFQLQVAMPGTRQLAKVGGHSGYVTKAVRKAWSFPLWFGTEEQGMTVYTESDQWWVNPNPRTAFVLAPEGEVTRLHVNFIQAPTVFKAGSRFAVSFQPTPVREFPRSRPDMGLFHGAFLDMEKVPATVSCTYDAEKILDRNRGTLDMVLEPCFNPEMKMNPRLGKEPYIREIFSVVTLGQEHFRLCYSLPHGGFIADEGIQPTADTIWDGTRKLHFTGEYRLKPQEKVRLTLTWGDGFLTCYVNARQVAKAKLNRLFDSVILPDADGKASIRLGESICNFLTPQFGSGFRVYGIRLLRDCRKPSSNPLEKITGTILLDRFTSVRVQNGLLLTRPDCGPQGVVTAGGSVTERALNLFQVPEKMKVSCLDRILDTGTTAMVFHQGWSAIQSYYKPVDAVKLAALITACHQKGIKLLLYFGFELSDLAPEFEKWHRKVLRLHPDRPTPPLCQVRHDQRSGKVCYGSCWQDFITFAIAKTWERFDFDGVFIDAAMVPYPCPNELHGCGWRDSAGKLHATMPLHRYVNMIRRIHQIVKSHGGIITGNQAAGPLWAYPDSVWVGEGYKYKELAANPGKAIPLPEWRVNFAGRTTGVPGELLLYEYPPFWRRDAGWALAGLHGMFLRPEIWWKGSYLEKVGRMRQVFRENHLDQATYVGYFQPDCPVKSMTADVKVSVYQTADGWILWIANLGMKQADATLQFHPISKIKDVQQAVDPLSGASFPIRENRLKISVHPYDWRMLHIEMK